jgi:hypothetical protein
MYSYLLDDAVRLGNLAEVEEILTQGSSWFSSGYFGGPCWWCNPLQLAALKGFEDIMDLLRTAGCPVSDHFRENVESQGRIRHTVETGNISLVSCLVKAQSDAYIYLLHIRSGGTPISFVLHCLGMEIAKERFVNGSSPVLRNYKLNFNAISCGIQEAIDLLLTDDPDLSSSDIGLLMWDAIKEDKRERLQTLLDLGISTLCNIEVLSEGVFEMKHSGEILPNLEPLLGLKRVSALSWAVLNERYDIAKMLLLAGASTEDADADCGYALLFCAVYAGSLKFVRLLH